MFLGKFNLLNIFGIFGKEQQSFIYKQKEQPMTPQDAERRAQQLAEHFADYDDMRFYLKCVYSLSEGQIQSLVETADSKGRNPMYYFKKAAARRWQNDSTG